MVENMQMGCLSTIMRQADTQFIKDFGLRVQCPFDLQMLVDMLVK